MESVKAVDLRKSFNSHVAVDGVSLTVRAGTCYALLGPNGAGKTTTCEMLEGLQKPDAGSVQILGMDVATEKRRIQQKIGVQLQETQLYGRYTVRETLELFASFYPGTSDINQIIRQLGLEESVDKRVRDLSGGQKQRVYLGCALVHDPEVLFLDEPTAGLDPQSRRYIWDLVTDWKKAGRAVFLTTHYLDEAEELADLVAVMDRGKIVAEGTAQELRRQHSPWEVLKFTVTPWQESSWNHLCEVLPWLREGQVKDGVIECRITDVGERVPQLVRHLDQHQMKLTRLELRQSTLEDVFMALTGRAMRDGE